MLKVVATMIKSTVSAMQDGKASLAKSGRDLASATATPAWLRKHATCARSL
jgi:hypothetical protein